MNRAALLLASAAALAFIAWRARASMAPAEAADAGSVSHDWTGYAPEYWDTLQAMIDTPTSEELAQRNVAAFLAMIVRAEGGAYNALFGYPAAGRTFSSFADHPRVRTYERADEFIRNGRRDFTTAAGAYQITATTYDRLARKLGLSGFAPDVQDRMAVELIREKGALSDVRAGRFADAVAKVAGVWASLPGNVHRQAGQKNLAQVQGYYINAGGVLA